MAEQRRITKGNTLDQMLLIDIRNAIEDLTAALKIAPADRISLAREIRELQERTDKADAVTNILLSLHTEEELEAAEAEMDAQRSPLEEMEP